MRKTIAILLVIVAGALGMVHGTSRFRAERDEARSGARPPPARNGAPSAAEPAKAPETRASEPPTPAGPSEEDLARARALVEEAERAIEKGHFGEASRKFVDARAVCAAARTVDAVAVRRLAIRGEAKAKVLEALAQPVKPNDFASGDDLTKIVFASGREYVVRVLGQSEERVTFRLASGAELTFPASQIRRAEPCPPSEWRTRVLHGLEERRNKADPESALELYRLAYYCLENGLPEEAAPVLIEALSKNHIGLVIETFCDKGSRPSTDLLRIARGEKPPEPEPAEPGEATALAQQPPGEEGERPVDRTLRSSPLFRRAVERMESGRAHYRASYRGTAEAERELSRARAIFDEVLGLFEELQRSFPDSLEIEERLSELNQFRYDCLKRAEGNSR